MKLVFLAIGVATFFLTRSACASYPVIYIRALDCGSFQVNARTVIWRPTKLFEQSTGQTIFLQNRSRHISKKLDLRLHFSRDKELGGRSALDGEADTWQCVESKNGRSFLFLNFVCTNEESRSCRVAMDGDTAEWFQVYDDLGNEITSEATFKRLGIWELLLDPKVKAQELFPIGG